ncbi:fibronectin type III domain-containing protein [Mangrovivirga sp. M17]|uniref:Fibronectin type III domain-containing protein n=1 Tax=Mangrovivirga halotolerans TaxID=2993936 RepID=A0ABT3RS84_9BACT|nr:fibronectin type III domain-containing protein [Mangrovivirga halotolerans]MCX2744650.1 fibronectin type III domain-containing protein [Mangrovivirga halotolerans]
MNSRIFLFLLIGAFIVSCSEDEPIRKFDYDIKMSGVTINSSDITINQANVKAEGSIGAFYSRFYYKSKDQAEYQFIEDENNDRQEVLSNLDPATTYQVYYQVYDEKDTLNSGVFSFTTKAFPHDLDFSPLTDFTDYPHSSFNELYNQNYYFSHDKAFHKFYAPGISEYDISDISIYTIPDNENEKIFSEFEIISDTVIFQIPEGYNFTPANLGSFKYAKAVLKVKDWYQYLPSYGSILNGISDPGTYESNIGKFKIFNSKPYISEYFYGTVWGDDMLQLNGGFKGNSDGLYWDPSGAILTIWDQQGNVYNTYVFPNNLSTAECNDFQIWSNMGEEIEDNLLIYHHNKYSQVKTCGLPSGVYTAQIEVVMPNGRNDFTNKITITVE